MKQFMKNEKHIYLYSPIIIIGEVAMSE